MGSHFWDSMKWKVCQEGKPIRLRQLNWTEQKFYFTQIIMSLMTLVAFMIRKMKKQLL